MRIEVDGGVVKGLWDDHCPWEGQCGGAYFSFGRKKESGREALRAFTSM